MTKEEARNFLMMEKSKGKVITVSSLYKQIKNGKLCTNHLAQRFAGVWDNKTKGNLIKDVLLSNTIGEIIICEEVFDNGSKCLWITDGLQRTTVLCDFLNDKLVVSKKIKDYEIPYFVALKDENGNVLTENGKPVLEVEFCDIRGKKYSDLPEELQDSFADYNVRCLMLLGCNSVMTNNNTTRFNAGKPMNLSQVGYTVLSEDFKRKVDEILTSDFFSDETSTFFRPSSTKNGAMRRLIVEAIAASKYADKFCKDFSDLCDYMNDAASMEDFNEISADIEDLYAAKDKEVADMWNIKDSFLWFASYYRCKKIGKEASDFISFMKVFKESLHEKIVDGQSYDDFAGKTTKDHCVVEAKLNHIESLMKEYFHLVDEKVEGMSESEVFTVESEKMNEYLDEAEKTDLFVNCVEDGKRTETAAKVLMRIDGITDMTKQVTQNYMNAKRLEYGEMNDVLFCFDILNEWSLNLKDPSIINSKTIPEIMKFLKECYDSETDEEAGKFFVKFAENMELRYETIKSKFEEEKNNV